MKSLHFCGFCFSLGRILSKAGWLKNCRIRLILAVFFKHKIVLLEVSTTPVLRYYSARVRLLPASVMTLLTSALFSPLRTYGLMKESSPASVKITGLLFLSTSCRTGLN